MKDEQTEYQIKRIVCVALSSLISKEVTRDCILLVDQSKKLQTLETVGEMLGAAAMELNIKQEDVNRIVMQALERAKSMSIQSQNGQETQG